MEIEINSFINAKYGRQFPAENWKQWSTDVVEKGRTSQRNQIWSQPRRHWVINWNYLTLPERNLFVELFDRAHGAYNTFLITDDDDFACSVSECSVTAVTGDTTTQLIKSYHPSETETWDEDKKKIVPSGIYAPQIYLDGVAKTEDTHFTLADTTGIINWAGGGAPHGAMGGGEVVTADYHFYFQVRFLNDTNKAVSRNATRKTFGFDKKSKKVIRLK